MQTVRNQIISGLDCLQAANLFERMVKGLTKALGRADASTILSSAAGSKGKDAAQRALLALIVSLDAWAGPLKVQLVDSYYSISTVFAHQNRFQPQFFLFRANVDVNIERHILSVRDISRIIIVRNVREGMCRTALDFTVLDTRVWC